MPSGGPKHSILLEPSFKINVVKKKPQADLQIVENQFSKDGPCEFAIFTFRGGVILGLKSAMDPQKGKNKLQFCS